MAGTGHQQQFGFSGVAHFFEGTHGNAGIGIAADIKDRFAAAGRGVAADVEVGIGAAEEGPENPVEGAAPGRHPPGPLEQVRRNVFEDGGAQILFAREHRVRPITAGRHSPQVDRQSFGAFPQVTQRVFEVAVEKEPGRLAATKTRQVGGEHVVAGLPQGDDPATTVEIGPAPGEPGMQQQHGAARLRRRGRVKGGRQNAALPARQVELFGGLQLGRSGRNRVVSRMGGQGAEKPAAGLLLPERRSRIRDLEHATS